MKKELTARQNEIVDAALRLIAEKGMRNLTIRHLSQALGVTDAVLYYHFHDKVEIVQALVGRFEADADNIKPLHGWAAIEAALVHRTELVLATPGLARVVFAEELFQGDPEVEQILFGMMQRHHKVMLKHFKVHRGGQAQRATLRRHALAGHGTDGFLSVVGPGGDKRLAL